ncbi:AAA family ATPase [Campylobacter devanensis]|uniref:AAA family ATPase n=1 Tax=Campylobacter devanensis TaxID=3161138 RepID=UPI001EF053E8|nr:MULTISPECIES: AAA family ATPase [unclassified Campylobacter]
MKKSIIKTIIINRAVPGSGKTTITNCIINTLKEHNISVALHSTDEYFIKDNRYIFDVSKLQEFHAQNLAEFQKSIKNKIDVIICDNTNLAPWQSEPYTTLARQNGYQIVFITLDPREIEKHVKAQQITDEKPDAHGVDEKVLKEMIDEYCLFDILLDKNAKIDPSMHFHYKWNKTTCQKEPTGKIAKHFDSDFIIRILPDEYKEIQKNIGQKILNILQG